ncbi:MAG: type IX secretion system sortase PorU, partial [Bacteroidales bacterium]|nr:type IX secretion system sortase PorU [Bacteroidales bacterium]
EPKYLLLFGDASFDYKDRIPDNSNYVPTWESPESLNPVSSYIKDDFFGLLDGDNMVDIGIGRFVVSSVSQAKSSVDKTIHYAVNSDEVMGDWRNIICLIADDEDNNLHFNDAEKIAFQIDTSNQDINIDKIYLDAYEQVSTPSGERYPKVTQDINTRVDRGALMMNYIGHGGELGLAHERILKIADINSWKNYDNMPVFITATCEFSRFDDAERTSAGEYVFLNPNGGGISLFTTTRATYAGGNLRLNRNINYYALNKFDGEYLRMGEVIRLAKNATGSDDNTRKFALLGDPALHFAHPQHNVVTATINNISVLELTDTIKALSEVTITGEMQDYLGNKLTEFDGTLFPIVFDKPAKYTTQANDPQSTPATFYIQKNALYKGKASIINGEWSYSFIVPKDIAYSYGYGKLSYYAKTGSEDAAGNYMDIIVGGYNDNASADNQGPVVRLYLNDDSFVYGGITDENPSLLAYVYDESGINTVGNGIGHDILATLDESGNYILNDYYESELDDFQNGTITYPFFKLANGHHQLSLKVWDIYNNSTTVYTEFVVAESHQMALESVMNYPNPFIESTQFSFEHNQTDQPLEVTIRIYTMNGQLVQTLTDQYFAGGYKYHSIAWKGTDEGGNKLNQGMYIYKVLVRNYNGSVSEETDKLIILR